MKILISGSTGFIGTALVPALKEAGHEITRLVRTDTCLKEACLQWNPTRSEIEKERLEGFEAVVSLGGVNLSSGRWTKAFMKEIYDSRIQSTGLLAATLAGLHRKPRLWLSASAVGYYGSNPAGLVDESSAAGEGFLARVCQEWEAACQPALNAGIRVISLRLGAVLGLRGGALSRMLPIFKLGLGGKLGSGRQMMSWISIDDLIRAVRHLLESDSVSGPVNLVGPHSVTNSEFTRQLGKALGRPAFLPVPALVLRALFGEMAKYLLLSSASVTPRKLLETGFEYTHPELGPYLTQLIRK